MQYQCSYDDIEKGICYFLSTNPDKAFTSKEIMKSMLDEKICSGLVYYVDDNFDAVFEAKCKNASKSFPKIKIIKNTFVFSTSNTINLESIKHIALNSHDFPEISFNDIYMEGQTFFHILASNALHEHLLHLSQNVTIDPHIKNDANQTLFDVIPLSQEGHATFKVLFNIFLSQHTQQLKTMKEMNKLMTKTNDSLEVQLYEVSREKSQFEKKNKDLTREYDKVLMLLSEKDQKILFRTIIIAILFVFVVFVNINLTVTHIY